MNSWFSIRWLVLMSLAAGLVLAGWEPAEATLYEVGPGKPYENINDVPLENIAAGDTVLIYYRATPYKEKWVVTAQGTEANPVRFEGVPGGGGELPVLDGDGATTRQQLSFWSENRAVIKLGESSVPPDVTPSWITIENFDIKSARPGYFFTDDTGAQQEYAAAASAIWIVKGRNVTVRNCIFRDCGNGFMTYSTDAEASGDILLEGCYIYDNGIEASVYQHNNYTASQGITFQYNHLGPLRTGCTGNNLKDRSSGMVIRYNWIESGNRQLDLVDAEDSTIITGDPAYDEAFMYGNILIEHEGDGNRQVCHFGADGGAKPRVDGYFYNNTVVSTRTGLTTLFRASNTGTVDCRNNIVYVTASGNNLEVSNDSDGTVDISHNWFKTGYVLVGGSGGTVNDDGTSVTGSDPGFVDEGGEDYHITDVSQCRDAGTTLHAATLPDNNLYEQYVKHQSHESRPNDGTFDIGAFEYSSGGPPPDLEITTTSLPDGVINVAYSATLECTGGLWPYTWSVISGSLPPGLSLNSSSGVISGTPTGFGTFNFTVQVEDSQDPADSDTQALSIFVNLQGLEIIGPPSMRQAYQGVDYSQQLSADKGLPPYTWAIISGSLPSGMSLNSSTGEISGAAGSTGLSNFTVQVTDSQGTPDIDQKDYSIDVVTAPPANLYYVAPGGSDGWDGSWANPWATLQHAVDTISAGDIILVRPGTYAGCRIESSGTASLPKTVASETIGAATLNAPGPSQVYNGSIELETTGGTVSYWVVDGFKIDGGGTYRCVDLRTTTYITVKNNEVLGSNSTGIYTHYSDYSLLENNHCHNNAGSGMYCQSSADNGIVRGNLSHNNASSGLGMNAYSYDPGDGLMSGWLIEKNTVYSNANGFQCDGVEDSTFRNNLIYASSSKALYFVGLDGNTTSRNNRVLNNTMVSMDPSYYNIMIYNDYPAGIPAGVGNKLFNNILYNYDPRINRGSICIDTAAETGFESNYNVVMEMFGLDDNAQYITFAEWQGRGHDLNSIQAADTALFVDPANYDYHLKDGSPAIDNGTTLADVTEDIEGNARPYNGVFDIGCYEKTAGAPANLVITTTSLPDGQVGIYYSETLEATGGVTPYTWAVISGSLPAGLSLNSSSGEISGTPTSQETANFTVEVTDSQGTPDTDQQALSIAVSGVADLVITTTSLPNGQVAAAYSQTLAATGGVTPYTWAVTVGILPAGLSLNSSTGEISGTPTTQETANFTVEVTDSQTTPDTDTQALSITIDPAAPVTITTTSLPDGTVSVPYNVTLAATGGLTPYSWAVTVGALPAGLSLNSSTGQISGTPTTEETANFTVEVTDSQVPADTDTQALSITITTAAENTYYVSTTGNDGWDGSFATPWATIQHAVDTIQPGDTIIVLPGTYIGARIESTAVAGLPKTLKAQTAGTVLLNAPDAARAKHNGVLEIENWDQTTSYWVIEDLEIDGVSNTYRCVDLRDTDHCEIRNNIVHDAYMTGIFAAFSYNLLVENNTSYDNGEHGIYCNNSADDGVIRGNTSYNNTANGIHMNGDLSMGGDGIMTNWLVEDNVCYDNPATGINCDGVEDSTMRNNLLYHNNSKGFSIYGIDGAISSRNNRILNNTCVMPTNGNGYYVITITDDAGPPVGNKIFNNILYHYSTASNRGSICMATSGETGFESNYNVVMEYFGLNDNAQILTFAQWQARGYDLNSIQATDTALFVDPTGDDFHLKSDSPAKDAGTTLADVTDDIEGNSRPQGSAYDIGCYEYVEGVADLQITTTSLPDGDAGVYYSQTVQATGGVTPYTWAVISGSLPSGLSLNSSTGEISGTPDTGQTANFTVEVTDSQGPPDTDTQALSITINVADLVITTTSLPDGVVGVGYSQTLAATGGLTPYTWAVVSGSLPEGLSLNSSTGEISGTPTTQQTANFTVEVTDSQGTPDTDQQALSITIQAAPEPLVITTTSLPDGTVNTAYSETLTATGGVTPYTWAVISGSLPAGLSLNSSTGEISGTPTAVETANFTVEVTDSQGPPDSDQKALSITINPEDLVIATTSLADGTVDVAYSQTVQATGGVTPYTWSIIAGSLPAGLSLNSSTGEISGTPTTAETANFTIQVEDSQGTPDTDTQALSITISEMGALTYEYAVSEAEETNNTETWQDKVTLNFSSTEADDWLILAFSDNRGDYWGGKANIQLLVDGAQEGEMLRRPHHSTWFPYTALKLANLDAGSHTINLQFRQVGDPLQDVYLRRSRVVAIKKDDLEIATASAEGSQLVPTSPTDIVTLNWTPSAAGDYLLVYFAEFQAGWTDMLYIDTEHNGAVLDSSADETRSDTDWGTWMSVSVVSCDTSEQTAKFVASGSATDGMVRRVRVAAVRLTGSPLAGFQSAADDTPSSTTQTTYQQKLTKSWDAGAEAGDWLLLSSAQLNQDPTSYQCMVRMQLNDTSTVTEQNRVPILNTHWVDYACMGIESLSGTNQVDIDYCSNNAGSTTTIEYVHFVALPLTAAAGPPALEITTTSLADGQIGVAYSQTLAATGGVTPYSWAVVSGSLPAGLSLNSSTGEISGTPTAAGTSNFTVEVTDSDGPPATDQQALSIYIPDDLVVTTASLADGQIGVAYSQTLAATGGVTPYIWSTVSGSLPAGLSLNSSTGEISGTPTTAGTSNFTVRCTDSQTPADTDDQALSIYIPQDLVVTTSSLDDGQIGVAYSQTLAATGGVTPYSWSAVSGSLPAGLSLNSSTGEISGTPTTAGTSNFTVRCTDSQTPADTDDRALSIYIPDDLAVTTASLGDGQVGVAYSETLAATGGVTPYSWVVVVGSLPAGLSLNSSTGEISGTPTTAETANFTVEVTDSQAPADSDQQALSITIDPETLTITTASLPDGQVGVAYSEALTATGGITPYSWAVVVGSLPAGLSLNSSTGQISGTPTAYCTSNFTVEVTDSDAPPSTDQQALSITVDPAVLEITTSSLPDGQVGVPYSETLAATGGVTPYSWAVVVGSLPAGLSLNSSTGEISGTPTTAETANFTVEVTDSDAPPSTDQQALSITINPETLTITTSSLPDGQVGVAYSETLAATGGITPYSWAVVSGSLPAGLSLNASTGEVSGTPTAYGTSNFTVEVTDSDSPPSTDQQALSITINPETLTITTSSLPDGQISIAYSQTLAAAGGVTPYSWAVIAGSLPAGLSLNSSTGEISGTPTTGETANFTVEVTDSDAPASTDQQALSIYIPDDLVVTTSSLPDGQIGVAYSQTVAATGGVTPYSWSIVAGSLPAGLSLNSFTGEISGTPTAAGTSNFTVRCTDSQTPADTDDKALSIYIPDDLVVTTSSLADGQISVAYSQTLAATGGVTPYGWSIVSGSLPAGLSLNSGTGEISGTPTAAGTSNFTVRVTDSQAPADTDDQALSIYIPDDLVVTTSSLPDGTLGVAYSETLAATGGVTPYNWSIVAGSLPAGLSLNTATGEISGTPTTEQTANFTVEVSDSQVPADGDQQALSITIQPAAGPQTYYVSTTGDDGWDGSSGTPWATIQYAVDQILPGDTIIVRDGTYVGARIRSSGTVGSVKTLKAENAGMAVVNSAGALCTTPSNLEVIADTPADGVTYWEIDGFETTASTNYGIEMQYGGNVTIRNCTSHANAKAGFFIVQSNYCLVEDNSAYSATSGSGFVLGDSGDNNTVRGNLSYNNASNGIIVINAAGADRISSDYVIEKNTFYGNVNGIQLDGVEDSLIANNLVYDSTSKAIFFVGNEGLVTSRNNKLVNNTMVMPTDGTGSFVVLIYRVTGGIPEGTGNKFYNNILYHYGTAADDCSIVIDTAAETGFESNYNVVMDAFGLDDGATLLTLAEWQARGHDLNSVQAADTALFVDPASYDYHLKSDSPAKDAGTTRAEVTDDMEGVARPQGTDYDIGCYEYVEGIPDLVITTTTLDDGVVGEAYSQTCQATGGLTPYSWAVITGSLPAGLSLNSSTGEISGTPTTAETPNFTVEVTDSQGVPDTDTQALSITIFEDLVVTTAGLPDGTVGVAYSQTLAATGGLAPYSWSVVAGSLPAGLSLNSSTGEISGTPTTAETANFTVEVTDSANPGDSDQQALSITIYDDLVITTSSLPDGTVGVAYSQTLAAAGGLAPYSWSVVVGSLPAGLSLNSSTGEISGTPTTAETANFTVEVTDSQAVPDTDQQALSITIDPAIEDLVITTTSLDDGVVGEAYSQTCQATGGLTPYSWAVVSGSLPAGLSINSSTGEISGTPTSAGTSNFTVEVTDSQPVPDTDTQALSITIFEDLVVTTTSLPDGTVGVVYSQTLAATGGLAPYSWSVVSGSLPAGLSLNSSTGEISGTPTTAGTANFTVEVTDSASPGDSDQQALSITIYDDLVITTSSLPDGTVGVAYSQTLAATGGLAPYTWSLVSGSLPAGLSLNSSTGEISGTPTTEETANFTVEVTDSQAVPDSDQQVLSITINPAADPLVITTTSLPDGQKKQAYSETLQATGGVTPYTWSIVAGSLPNGLSLNSSTGEISGTCRKDGTFNFTVRVEDSQEPADFDEKALSIVVNK